MGQEQQQQGLITEQKSIVNQLHYRLLNDAQPYRQIVAGTSGCWLLLPAILVLILVTVLLYGKTGSLLPLTEWQRDVKAYPQLRPRLLDPDGDTLILPELVRFQTGCVLIYRTTQLTQITGLCWRAWLWFFARVSWQNRRSDRR